MKKSDCIIVTVVISITLICSFFYILLDVIGLKNETFILTISISYLLIILTLIIFMLFERWSNFKIDLKRIEIEKIEKEFDMKKEFLEVQSIENKNKREFEAEQKPKFTLIEALSASKLKATTTKTTINTNSNEKIEEKSEDESFDIDSFEDILKIINDKK